MYQTEKQIKELGDKVPAEVKSKVEASVNSLKEASAKDDTDAMKAAIESLRTETMAMGQAMYQVIASLNFGSCCRAGMCMCWAAADCLCKRYCASIICCMWTGRINSWLQAMMVLACKHWAVFFICRPAEFVGPCHNHVGSKHGYQLVPVRLQ